MNLQYITFKKENYPERESSFYALCDTFWIGGHNIPSIKKKAAKAYDINSGGINELFSKWMYFRKPVIRTSAVRPVGIDEIFQKGNDFIYVNGNGTKSKHSLQPWALSNMAKHIKAYRQMYGPDIFLEKQRGQLFLKNNNAINSILIAYVK